MEAASPPSHGLRVLIVDDEESIRLPLSLSLRSDGHQVTAVATVQASLVEVSHRAFDLIFLDLRLGVDNGLDLIPRLLAENPWAKIVVIASYASVETAVEAMKRGATDYLPKPFTGAQVRLVTRTLAERRELEHRLQTLQSMLEDDPDAGMPTVSTSMRQAIELARRVARSTAPLLIKGEVGAGKDRMARAIHAWSGRSRSAFAAVSCGGLSAENLELELFGVSAQDAPEAPRAHRGRAAFCDGGTLVLHEIGQAPLSLQPKLLRFIRDREYERVNDVTSRRVDVRVIGTTTEDLSGAARRGTFRPELLLAVDVVSIEIPPLRARPDDVRLLADRYLAFYAHANRRPAVGFSPDAIDALTRHSYPGNLRELRNLIERAVLLCEGERIGLEHLPSNLLNSHAYAVGDLVSLQKISDLHIARVLASTRSYEAAAAVLGINSITLWRRRKRYGAAFDKPAGAAAP